MPLRPDKLDAMIGRLEAALVAASPALSSQARAAIERWRADASALRFHLTATSKRRENDPVLVAVIGGTGTGKSTLVNRLLGADVSATSFRRTFTAGPVALVRRAEDLPEDWLGVERVAPDELPARGRPGAIVVVSVDNELTHKVALVDTPDLDGDQPAHHAQADRAFRWAEAVLFLVTPEKYQMTELFPYYRLARRYALPAMFVMNKVEEQAVVDDYRRLLDSAEGSGFRLQASGARADSGAAIFAVARDDAGYEPPAGANLVVLREQLMSVARPDAPAREIGLRQRASDLLGRFTDQVLAPLRDDRREADRLIAAVRAMETPPAGVDVNPLTQQLQRRLQQRSILYLMGPQRVLDRVRQAPGLLMRLPRVAWDYVMRGEISAATLNPDGGANAEQTVPDFRALLMDQFAILHSRIDDVLRSAPTGERWLNEPADAGASGSYAAARIDPAEAGRIAEEELADLRQWLEKRWNATPRDTRALQALLKHLPGGAKLANWTEAAPYLLTVVLVAHHFAFFPFDVLVLGGYSLATWLTERISNEVAARTRTTNARIADRFAELSHRQIRNVIDWLDRRAPSAKALEQIERLAGEANDSLG